MLPKWHFLLGILFTTLVCIVFSETNLIYLFLIFFGAFFIDFDHYMVAVWKTGKLGLFKAFEYHKKRDLEARRLKNKKIRRKGDFHIFHTFEFHLLVFLLGYLWVGFFYLVVGMIFHSLLDIVDLTVRDYLYRREFFLINWLRKKIRES